MTRSSPQAQSPRAPSRPGGRPSPDPSALGGLSPAAAAAPLHTMILAQARLEVRLLLRNAEQLLIILVIPILVLLGLAFSDLVATTTGPDRLDGVVAGVLALCVLSTAFTSTAIATGFERRHGALKRLGSSPLPRGGLLAGKTLAVLLVEAVQVSTVLLLAAVLGWRPAVLTRGVTEGLVAIVGTGMLLLTASAAFAALGLLMAGTMRAEATLAAANLVYLLLLGAGGVIIPTEQMPASAGSFVAYTPSAALADGLRSLLEGGGSVQVAQAAVVLLTWTVAAAAAAARWFRWE